MSALDTVIDVLHGAGVAGFTFDPAVDPPVATVKGGEMGGATTWWASCKVCWWWDEDEPDHRTAFDPATAQARADAHNRIHHALTSTVTGFPTTNEAPCPG